MTQTYPIYQSGASILSFDQSEAPLLTIDQSEDQNLRRWHGMVLTLGDPLMITMSHCGYNFYLKYLAHVRSKIGSDALL